MILEIDSAAGIIKIGSPPEILPGIVESIKIKDSLLLDNAEIQGQSGKQKNAQGWDDASLSITLSLIDNPRIGKTRWHYLEQVAGIFKKVTEEGTPEIYTLNHPMINVWGIRRLLFTSLESTESRTRRKVSVSLEFMEYESASGVIQSRQESVTAAQQSISDIIPPSDDISTSLQLGLEELEVRYAKL